jgi:hypothetical protein
MKRTTFKSRLLWAGLVVCAVASLAGQSAVAQIEAERLLVQNANPMDARFATNAAGTFSVPYTIQSPNTQVLVVGVYIDAAASPIAGLQFNGVAPAATQLYSNRTSLAYWNVVPGVGTYNLTGDINATAISYGNGYVWELSGLDLTQPVNSDVATGNLPLSNSMTTSTPDRLVIDFFGGNKQGGTVAPSANSIISNFTGLQFGGPGGGMVAGGSGTAINSGTQTLGWVAATGDAGSGSNSELAYAFALPSTQLELNVNTFTGQVEIVNPNDNPIAIDYYRITSSGGALSPQTWNSLDDQDVDAVGMAAGESWDENGNPDANEVIELFLLGQTNLATNAERNLGQLFNPQTFGKREDGDLVFQFGVPGQTQLRTGVVNYVTPPGLLGDYNDDGEVDAADYTVWRNAIGGVPGVTLPPSNDSTPGSVTLADYQVWKDYYGESLNLGSGSSAESENVPEPASLALAAIGVFAVAGVAARRRRT